MLSTLIANASATTQHQIQLSCLIQRNPIIQAPLSPFEESYEEYQDLMQFQTGRSVFSISPTNGVNSEVEKKRMPDSIANTFEDCDAAIHKPISLVEKMTANVENRHLMFDGGSAARSIKQETLLESTRDDSMWRCLDRKLYLVIFREGYGWDLPWWPVEISAQTETSSPAQLLRQEASQLLGPHASIHWVGNAPVAYFGETFTDRTKAPFGVKASY